MRFKTVKGELFGDHIISNDKTIWLTKDSKGKGKGYFLLKRVSFYYELLRMLREKNE